MTTYYDARIDWNFIRGKEGDWSVGYVPNIKNRRGVIKSGTTILFGFDLGQHDLSELKELHLTPGLESKLAPYLGAKGADAVMAPQRRLEGALDSLISINNAQTGARTAPVGTMRNRGVVNQPNVSAKLGQTPRQFVAPETTLLRLELNSAERQQLTQAIQKHFYERLRTHYDTHRKGRRFSELPVGIQTALLSLSWQSGNIWSVRHPAYSLFKEALQEHWAAVAAALRKGLVITHGSSVDAARRRAEGGLIDAAISSSGAKSPAINTAILR